MSNDRLEISCQRCQKVIAIEVAKLGAAEQVIYRDAERVREETYRVQCPQCRTYNVVTLAVKRD